MHYKSLFLNFASVFKSKFLFALEYWWMDEVKGHIQTKYTRDHVFSLWALQCSTVKDTSSWQRHQNESTGRTCGGFALYNTTAENDSTPSRHNTVNPEGKRLYCCLDVQNVNVNFWLSWGDAKLSFPFHPLEGGVDQHFFFGPAAPIKAAVGLRSLIISDSADETLNTSPCYHACLSLVKQFNTSILLLYWSREVA